MRKKLLIAGSRDYPHLELINAFFTGLDDACYQHGLEAPLIITGGARGVDRYANQMAKYRGYIRLTINADWTQYGKSAGVIRNSAMVKEADYVVCFWDGKSKGTADTIQKAREAGKLLAVFGVLT